MFIDDEDLAGSKVRVLSPSRRRPVEPAPESKAEPDIKAIVKALVEAMPKPPEGTPFLPCNIEIEVLERAPDRSIRRVRITEVE